MNTAYDLGGAAGFGRVVTPDGEASFHADWEKRVLGLVRQLRVLPGETSAAWRTILERMDATTYLTSTYYERFVTVVTERAINQGLVTEQELRERIATMKAGTWAGEPPGAPAAPREAFDMSGRRQNARHEAGAPPKFAVGNRVCVRDYHPAGHTRLPRYVRGRSGTVIRVNGFYLLEDSDKAGLGPEPQPVYTVRFTAQELWGPAVTAPDSVCAELWQGYLERGTAPRKGDGNAQT